MRKRELILNKYKKTIYIYIFLNWYLNFIYSVCSEEKRTALYMDSLQYNASQIITDRRNVHHNIVGNTTGSCYIERNLHG